MTELNRLLIVERQRDLLRAAERAAVGRDARPDAGRWTRRLGGLRRSGPWTRAAEADGGRRTSADCAR
jgi:hypothetical protein